MKNLILVIALLITAPFQWAIVWVDETNVQMPTKKVALIGAVTLQEALQEFDYQYGDGRIILSACRTDQRDCVVKSVRRAGKDENSL